MSPSSGEPFLLVVVEQQQASHNLSVFLHLVQQQHTPTTVVSIVAIEATTPSMRVSLYELKKQKQDGQARDPNMIPKPTIIKKTR